MGEEEEERWRERTEEGGEAEKVVGDAGPEPRVRRAARREQKRQGSGFSTEPAGRSVALKKRKNAAKSLHHVVFLPITQQSESPVCAHVPLPLEAPFPHPPTALGHHPAEPSSRAAGSAPSCSRRGDVHGQPPPPPRSSHPSFPTPTPTSAHPVSASASLFWR